MTQNPKYSNIKCTSLKTKIMESAGLNIFVAKRIVDKIFWDGYSHKEDFNRKIQKQYLDEKSGIRVQVHYVWLEDRSRPECDYKLLDIRFIRNI